MAERAARRLPDSAGTNGPCQRRVAAQRSALFGLRSRQCRVPSPGASVGSRRRAGGARWTGRARHMAEHHPRGTGRSADAFSFGAGCWRVKRGRSICRLLTRPFLLRRGPGDAYLSLRSQPPDRDAGVRDPDYFAYSPGLGIKVGMAGGVERRQPLPMAQGWLIEIRVACEKRGTALSTQQNQNLLIFQALAAEVEANLSRGHPPC